jgi:hypothetical protein
MNCLDCQSRTCLACRLEDKAHRHRERALKLELRAKAVRQRRARYSRRTRPFPTQELP